MMHLLEEHRESLSAAWKPTVWHQSLREGEVLDLDTSAQAEVPV